MATAGGVPRRDLDAALAALLAEGVGSLGATVDFVRALDEATGRIDAPADRPRPIVLPCYSGTRRQRNLTALVALMLRRFGAPVIVHGPVDAAAPADAGSGIRVATIDVLRELGVAPSTSLADARARLARDNLAAVPLDLLVPRLASLLAAHRGREAAPTIGTMARLIEPCGGEGYRVIGVARAAELSPMRALLAATRADAMLFVGAEGEPFADPSLPPAIEQIARGEASTCAMAETSSEDGALSAPLRDAAATAAWISRVLAGELPVPAPIVAQLACCLHGAQRPAVAAAA